MPIERTDAITWKQAAWIAAIGSLLWGAAFGLGSQLYYPIRSGVVLEQRLSTAERDMAKLSSLLEQNTRNQTEIIKNQNRIIDLLDEERGTHLGRIK